MSNTVVFLLITAAIFALLALWAPCLYLCRRGVRKMTRRRELLAAAVVAVGVSLLAGCSDSGSPTTVAPANAATTLYATNEPNGTNSTGQIDPGV